MKEAASIIEFRILNLLITFMFWTLYLQFD